MSTFRRSPYLPPLPFFPFPRLYLCPLPPIFLSTQATVFCQPSPPQKHCSKRPGAAGNFRSQKGTLTQNRGYSYADILPHGTAKRLKGTRRPDKATILSATRKQV